MKKLVSVLGGCVLSVLTAGSATGADCACKPPGGADLTGRWSFMGDGFTVDPNSGRSTAPVPAFTPEYEAKNKKLQEVVKAIETDSVAKPDETSAVLVRRETACLPYGMPLMMRGHYSIEIFQTPREVAVIAEAMFEARRIYLNRPQETLEDVDIGYEGHSVGHWEGGTLVVNTIGVKASVLGYNDMPHSDKMVLDERIRLLSPDLLEDRITINDPVALLKPYHVAFTLLRRKDDETPEFVCDNPRDKIDSQGKVYMDLNSSSK